MIGISFLDRIDPEERPPGAAPRPRADRQRVGRLRRIGQHGAAEAEAVAVAAHVDALRPVPMWFENIMSTVIRPSSRWPLYSPPFRSICENLK